MKMSAIDHVAISVRDVQASVDWYTEKFDCSVKYQDATWALLEFANIRLALVIPDQHPAHIGLVSPDAESFGTLKTHRDGTRSVYINDPSGNAVEVLAGDSMPQDTP